jgi:hypothetical protein
MDNKKKAAELVMEFLPIVGQDPYTGINTAKECAKVSAKLLMKTEEEMDCGEINGNCYNWDEVIKLIDTF